MVKFDMMPRPADNPPAYPRASRLESIELDDLRKVEVTRANTAPDATPYLGLQSRLSQVWLNRWTVLLLLVLVRVAVVLSSLDDSIGDARGNALAACTKVEDVGSNMASMPHYLSRGVNELAASSVESAVRATAASMQLSATVVENLILFTIGMMTDTYADLTAALIRGSAETAHDAVSQFSEASNKTIADIADDLERDANDIQEKIDAVVKEIEQTVFGQDLPDVPRVDVSSALEKLRTVDFDTERFTSDIDDLESDLPSFSSVRNATERAVSGPFERIRRGLNDTFADFSFDGTTFPLAGKQRLTFCSDGSDLNSFFDGLHSTVGTSRTVLVAVLASLALVAMAPMAYLEITRWRKQRDNARMAEQGMYDPLDVVYLSSRPLSAGLGMRLSSRFSGRRQVLVRWCVAYATSLPALFVLSLAIAGLLSCLCQLIVLRNVQARVPALAERVGDFAGDVVTRLEGSSKEWAAAGNDVLSDLDKELNADLLELVKEGTSAVDDALDTFAGDMQRGLETALGRALSNTTDDLTRGLKALNSDTVQRGLTWLESQAKLTFPSLPENAFSLGARDSIDSDSELTSFLASPGSATTDEVSGSVQAVVRALEGAIKFEAFVAGGLLAIWIIVVLVGVVRVLVAGGGGRSRGESTAVYPLAPLPAPVASPVHAPSVRSEPRAEQRGGDPFSDGYGDIDEYYSVGTGLGGVGARGGMAETAGDEKCVASVRGGTARRVTMHERQSSHGDVCPGGKF